MTGSARPAPLQTPMDPLAAVRHEAAEPQDVFLTGTVFLDIIFTGLDHGPVRGTESWARGMGSSPGGIANMATALRRLGLRTSLAATFGDDVYGDYCWESLADAEGIDLSPSHRAPGWHSPVTVSMAYDGDRTMVSHGHKAPGPAVRVDERPRSRACITSLSPGPVEDWVVAAHEEGSKIFADVGWDESGVWDRATLDGLARCLAFLPNATEAQHYTRTDDPESAVRALADLVPIAVVTKGAGGAVAIDSTTGERADVPALPVESLDPTGAGDVFVAGFTTGTLAGWPLADRLAFANLTAALSVQHFGGSLSAPGWSEVAAWWQYATRCGGQSEDVMRRYGFLDDLLPAGTGAQALRRATPTIGFRAP
ncbi:carbohydrate kinase family protein [Streptomyces sp. NPDC050560]|uniref:carbohydrate kinase family protein n=1 Tax=Streptomyces sp. NPDC050560 TaxID=3365630 RepID=UPI003788B587